TSSSSAPASPSVARASANSPDLAGAPPVRTLHTSTNPGTTPSTTPSTNPRTRRAAHERAWLESGADRGRADRAGRAGLCHRCSSPLVAGGLDRVADGCVHDEYGRRELAV